MRVSGRNLLKDAPSWCLKGNPIENVSSLEVLGVSFGDTDGSMHANKRMDKCRRAFYSLRDVGLSYPGSSVEVKGYLWKSICQPVLLYGIETLNISSSTMQKLESQQGSLIKQCLGLSKRQRSSSLLQALEVRKIEDRLKQFSAALLKRIFQVNSPALELNAFFYSTYALSGSVIPGTLLARIVSLGLSPTVCMFSRYRNIKYDDQDGIVDSLRDLIRHENFLKPYSEEHVLTSLLTKAF